MCVFHQVQSHYFKLGMSQWLVSLSRLEYLNRITEKFCTYNHGHQRINPIDFSEPLEFNFSATHRSRFSFIQQNIST